MTTASCDHDQRKIDNIELRYGNAVFKVFFRKPIASRKHDILYHLHHFYELHFCLGGSYVYTLENKEVTLSQSQMLIIPPGVNHSSLKFHTSDNYIGFVFQFSLQRSNDSYDFFDYFKDTLDTSAQKAILLPMPLIQQFAELSTMEAPRNLKSYCNITATTYTLLFEMFDAINNYSSHIDMLSLEQDPENMLFKLNGLVNLHELSLKHIAAELNYSELHAARLIKQIYNSSLTEIYKENMKIDQYLMQKNEKGNHQDE